MKRFFLPLIFILVLSSCDKSEIEKEKPLMGNLQEAPNIKDANEILNSTPTYYCNCKTDNRINTFNDDAGTLIWKGSGSNLIYQAEYIYYGTDLSGSNINMVITTDGIKCKSYDGITGVSFGDTKHIAYMGPNKEVYYGYEHPYTHLWRVKRLGPNWKTYRQPAIGYINNTIYVFWVALDNQIWYTTPALADQAILYRVSNFKSNWGLYALSNLGNSITILLKGTNGNFYLSDATANSNGTLNFSLEQIKEYDQYDTSFNMFYENGELTINYIVHGSINTNPYPYLEFSPFLNIEIPFPIVNYTYKRSTGSWVSTMIFAPTEITLNAPLYSVCGINMIYASNLDQYKCCFVKPQY